MLGNQVSLAHYEGIFKGVGSDGAFVDNFFQGANALADLNKAMGTAANPSAGIVSAGALIPQSLEGMLTSLTIQNKHFKLWNLIEKEPAYAMLEEFDQETSIGANLDSFVQEGALPLTDHSTYERKVRPVKLMGTVRQVTLPMQLVRTISGVGNMVEKEDQNGTRQLLRTVEQNLFDGDSRINPLAFDGIYATIDQDNPLNIIDLRGKPLTQNIMQDIDERSGNVYGTLDRIFMSTRSMNNLTQQFMSASQIRSLVNQFGQDYNLGISMEGKLFNGNNSSPSMHSHQLIRPGNTPPTVFSQDAPVAVTGFTATARAALPAENNQLAAATYNYAVAAVSQYGEGPAVEIAAPIALGAGDVIDLAWNNNNLGVVRYVIYRSTDGGALKRLLDVKVLPGATSSYIDLGKWIEGTSKAYFLQMTENVISWKQLAPLMKLNLATIDISTRWAILLFGLLQIRNPQRIFVCINVGEEGITHAVDIPRINN